jgi:hypothetical protein
MRLKAVMGLMGQMELVGEARVGEKGQAVTSQTGLHTSMRTG